MKPLEGEDDTAISFADTQLEFLPGQAPRVWITETRDGAKIAETTKQCLVEGLRNASWPAYDEAVWFKAFVPLNPGKQVSSNVYSESSGPVPDSTTVAIPRGRLPKALIQQTIRANFSTFSKCYEQGLERKPLLSGNVTTRFIIGTTGEVIDVSLHALTLPDCDVAACILDGYRSLKFPPPEGDGSVSVIYPISFKPGRG